MHLYHGLCCKPKKWYLKLKVSTEGILEVMQALEGILEVGGSLRRETVLWVFRWLFVLWCANFSTTWLVCPSSCIDLLISHGPRVWDLTLVTPLHVYLQAVCSPVSFLRLPILKRETCLVLNVNFWILINTAVSLQMFYWFPLPIESKTLGSLVLLRIPLLLSKCNVFTGRDVYVSQIDFRNKWAVLAIC